MMKLKCHIEKNKWNKLISCLFVFLLIVFSINKADASAYNTISTIDGTLSGYTDDEKRTNSTGTDWAGNVINYAYVTWDTTYLYIGVDGDMSSDLNELIIYVDKDYGSSNGSKSLSDNVGDLDNTISYCGIEDVPSDANFLPDFAIGWEADNGNNGIRGWASAGTTYTGAVDNFGWYPDGGNGLTIQGGGWSGEYEARIEWDDFFGSATLPDTARIAILIGIGNDGAHSNQFIPQDGSSVWVINVTNFEKKPITLWSPANNRPCTGALMITEIFCEGTGTNYEGMELYNFSNHIIDLQNYRMLEDWPALGKATDMQTITTLLVGDSFLISPHKMVTITEIGTLAKFNAAMPNAQGNVFALNGAITLTDAGSTPDSVGIYPPYSASETWPIDLLSYNIATAVKQSYEKKDITLNEWGTAIGSNWAVDNDPDTGTPGTHNTVSARTIDLVSTQTSISGGDSSYLTFSVKNTNTNDSIQWDSVVFEITSALGGTLTGGGTTYETYTYSNGVAFAKYTSPGTGGTETIIAYVKYYIDSTTASGVDTVAITVIVDPNPPVITVNRDSYVIKSDGAKYGKLFDIDFLDAGSNLDSAWIMTSSYGDTYTIFQTPGSSSYNAEWAVSNAFTQALGNGVNKCYIQARDVIGNTSSPSTIYIQKEVITATDGDTADWQSDEFLNSRRATSFRVAWDDTSLFINYDGAAGDLASEDIFVYIRTNYSAAPDQSATTINWGAYGTHTLPIECNVAFAIEDGATAKVYYNSSGTWTEVGTPNKDLFGGWSGKKSTELRVSWADFPSGKPDSMALVFVHQYDAASNLYNSLPLMNSANEQTNQTLTDYYLWDDLRETIAPNSFTVISTSTRSRSVDGEDIDWNTSYSPNTFDTSLVRDSEFIWRASDTDVRMDGTDPDDNYELKEFRVTSDQTNIYFLLKMKDISNTDTPLVIIGIDTDLISASGAYDLPAYSKTWTETSARYEMGFLACANRTLAYDWNYNEVNDGNSYLSEPNNLIEMSFPWSRLGVAPARRLRFTVIVCENNAGDAKKVTVGEEEPRALDGIAPSWMKTSQSGNFAGVVLPGDNTVDYYFDVDFDTAGWVIPHHITVTPSETYVFVNTEIPLTLKQMDFNENTCTTYAMGSNLIFSHDGNGTLIVTDSTTAWSNGQKTIKLKYNLEETITITCTETLHGKSGSFTVGFYVDTTQPNIWYVNDATYDANDSFTCAVGNAGNSGLSPFSPKLTINSVLPLLSDGDTVYIDAGTFQPGETLTIANNSVWLIGVDSAKTIIDFQVSTQAAFRSLYAANKNYVTVRDLQVKNGYFGIYFKTADYGEITRVNANTNGWIGIILESSADSNTVQYCYATGNSGYGFYLGDADRSLLRWNYALSNTLIGFLLGSGADTNTLIENKSKSNADGYKIDATSIGNIFQSDSSSNNSGAGFAVVSASAYNTFRSCTSTVDGAQGFYISDGGYAASNNQIIQCRIESSGADAIYVASHLCTATQNIISNPTGKGIYLNGSNDCTLDSNQVSWSTDVGIHVINNQRNTLRGNYVEHAKVDGIKFENSNYNTVSGCTTYAIVSAGFVVGGGSAYNNIMSCTGVQDTIGFYSDGGGNNNFNGIYLDDPKENGFQILASNDTYSNCTVNGPDQNGFYLLDTATNNIFDTNRVISPASRGFYITEQSDTNKFRWNQVSNADSEGFYLYNVQGNDFFYNFSIGHGNGGFKCEDTADSNAFHSDSTSGGTLSGFSVLLNSIHNSFSSCTALSAGASGFYINSDSTTLTNCRSRLSTAQGYYLLNSAFGTLSNCLSDYNTENNFYLNGADTNTVTSCTSVGAGNDGFKLDNSDGNLFTYNTAETSVTSGFAIMTGSYSNDFKLNKCTGATTSGFYIDENDNYFYRNLANNCGTNGFSIMGQSNIKVIGNEANNNTQYQIYIETGSSNLTISKNNIGAGGIGGVDVNIANATLERNWWSTKDTTALYARISGTGKSSADFTPFRLGAVDTVTATDTVAPQAPDTVSAVSPGAETATITWSEVTADEEADDNPPNLTKYLIYRSTTSDTTEWILKMEASSGSTSATDSGLTPGTVYYYRVTAIDNVSPYRNESFYSDSIASITPQLPVILISEVGVGYSAEPDSDFVELFVKQSNSNGQPINLNGWRIFISTASATASRSKKTFSNLIVSESSFVTVYFASGNKADETEDGSDSRALTYADSSNSTLPATQALIQLLSPYASDTQDAVYYSDQSSLNATLAAQLQDLVVAGQWSPDNTAGNTVSDVGLSLKGSCIRRDASFTDNNTKADWSFDSQTPGNMPLSRFYVSTDNSNPNVGDSFTLTLYAIDTRNDTIIGARFKVDTNISSGSMLPSYLKFITDHSDWNSGDTSVQAAIFGTSGDVVCTFSVNGGAQSGTVALTVSAPLSDLEVIVPEKVLRSSNFSLYIRAKDSVGNTKTDFTGAVNIGVDSYTISQNSITFTASDAGETTIQVQITGVGVITITCSTAAVSGYDTTVSVSDTHLVITEFLINENNRPGTTIDRDEFIELYNRGWAARDMTNYTLEIRTYANDLTYTFPALTVPAGKFVVVHFNKTGVDDTNFNDTDGAAHLYAINSSPSMGSYEDIMPHSGTSATWSTAISLYNSTTNDSTTILDFVGAEMGANTDSQLADTNAVDAGIWQLKKTLSFPSTAANNEGRSFYRLNEDSDTDSIYDWSTIDAGGATDSFRYTDGYSNRNNIWPSGAMTISLKSTSSSTGDTFVAGDTIYITLTAATDGDATSANTTNVFVYSDTDPTGIVVTLKETGINTKTFYGECFAATEPQESNDGMRNILAQPGDSLTVQWVGSADVKTTLASTGSLDHFDLSASPSTLYSGQSINLTVTARDAGGYKISTYTGLATITLSDSVCYPDSFTFVTADGGETTVSVIIGSNAGNVTCTVTSSSKVGTTTIAVLTDTDYVLNEILANVGTIDWDGSGVVSEGNDEWIEIYNKGSSNLPLTGYKLFHDGSLGTKITLAGTLPAKGWVTVYKGVSGSCTSVHFDSYAIYTETQSLVGTWSTHLTNTGGTVYLIDNSGNTVSQRTYPSLNNDSSYGLVPDGVGSEVTLKIPSPGSTPTPAPYNDSSPNAVIILDIPESVAIGASFTLNAVMVTRDNDTVTSWDGSCSVLIFQSGAITPTVSPTFISFTNGVASASITIDTGNAEDTASLFVRYIGAIQGGESIYLRLYGEPDEDSSQVNVTQAIADGIDTAEIQVIITTSDGTPLSGRSVTVTSSKGSADTISSSGTGTTDENGVASFTVVSLSTTPSKITVTVEGLTLVDSPYIYWLDSSESGVQQEFGTKTTITSTNDDSHFILFPSWRADGRALAYIAKTAAVDTWNAYVAYDDGSHGDGAADDGTFGIVQVTGNQHGVFQGSKVSFADILKADGTRCALGEAGDGVLDVIYSAYNGANRKDLFVVRSGGEDAAVARASTVRLTSTTGNWTMPVATSDTADVIYAIYQGSVYRLNAKGTTQHDGGSGGKLLLAGSGSPFYINDTPHVAVDLALYNKDVLAVTMIADKTGDLLKNKRSEILILLEVDTADYGKYTGINGTTCRRVNRPDSMVAWNLSWDTGGRCLSWSRDIKGNFNYILMWFYHAAPEAAYQYTDFDVEAIYVSDTWFTPNKPTSLINNSGGFNDHSAAFSPGAKARAAYVSYDSINSSVKLNVLDIDGVTQVNTDGGILFEDGRVTAIVDEGDLLSGSVKIQIAKPSGAPSNPNPDSIALTGNARNLFPNGQIFDDSITVILYYDAADLASAGITNGSPDEYQMRVYWYNSSSGAWEDYHATVDPTDQLGALGKLTFTTNHFSTYGIGYAPQHPNRPTLLSPTDGETMTSFFPTFSWIHNDPQNRPQIAFKLEISINSNFALTLLSEERNTSESTVALVSPLPAGDSRLYWRVRTSAVEGAFGAWSEGDSFFFTKIHYPSAPTLLLPDDSLETRTNAVEFYWLHNDIDGNPQKGFQIVLSNDSSFTTEKYSLATDTSGSRVALEPLEDGTYWWRVRTSDSNGFGDWSLSRRLTINTRPFAPSSLILPARITAPSALISWTHSDPDSRPQTACRILLALDSLFDNKFADIILDTSTNSLNISSVFFDNISGNETIFVQVMTASVSRNFGESVIGSFAANFNPPSAPSLLEPLDGTETTERNIILKWLHSDPDGDSQEGFALQVARDLGFSQMILNEAYTSLNSVVDINGLSGDTYFWRIATRDGYGQGLWSASRSFRVISIAQTPILTDPQDSSIINSHYPSFKWTHRDPNGYGQSAARIEISTDSSFGSIWRTKDILGNTQNYTLTQNDSLYFVGETKVYWRVKTASFGMDFGPVSNASSFMLQTSLPSTPITFSPVNEIVTRANELEFLWQHNSPQALSQSAFEFQLATDSTFSDSVVFRGLNEDGIAVGLTDWRRKYWRVRTANAIGWSDFSDSRTFNPPVWNEVALKSVKEVPAGETVNITLQLLSGGSSPTEWTGGQSIKIGSTTVPLNEIKVFGDYTTAVYSVRMDTAGAYSINVSEENIFDSVALFVLYRPLRETYVIACGASRVSQKFLSIDTSMTSILKTVSPDSTYRLKLTTLQDTVLVAPTAPTLIDSAGFVYWESIPINISGGRKVNIEVYQGGQLVTSALAYVLMKPSDTTQFVEYETSSTRVSLTVPDNAVSVPVWIQFNRSKSDSDLESPNSYARQSGRKYVEGSVIEIIAEDINGNPVTNFSKDLTLHIPASSGFAMKIAYLDGDKWVELNETEFDSEAQEARAKTNHLSVWGLTVGFPGTGSVAYARLYPNPWRSDGPTGNLLSSDPRYGMKIDQLPTGQVRFRVFTISGELVLDGTLDPSSLGATSANGHLQVVDVGGATGQVTRWDLKNQHGRDAASGLYMIVMEGPGGKAVKQYAIIR